MARLISIIYLVLVVILIINIWRQPGDPVKKILWTVVLLVVPIIGIVLFILLERSLLTKR